VTAARPVFTASWFPRENTQKHKRTQSNLTQKITLAQTNWC